MSTTLASGANTTITLPAGQVLYTGKTGNGTAVIGPGPQANQTFTLGTGARIGPYGNDVSVFLTSTQGAIDYQVGTAPGVPAGNPVVLDPLGPALSGDAAGAVLSAIARRTSFTESHSILGTLGQAPASQGNTTFQTVISTEQPFTQVRIGFINREVTPQTIDAFAVGASDALNLAGGPRAGAGAATMVAGALNGSASIIMSATTEVTSETVTFSDWIDCASVAWTGYPRKYLLHVQVFIAATSGYTWCQQGGTGSYPAYPNANGARIRDVGYRGNAQGNVIGSYAKSNGTVGIPMIIETRTMAGVKTVRCMLVGDSTQAANQNPLGADLNCWLDKACSLANDETSAIKFSSLNFGFGGQSTAQYNKRLVKLFAQYRPDHLFYAPYSVNDGGSTPAEIDRMIGRMYAVADLCTHYGVALTLVTPCPSNALNLTQDNLRKGAIVTIKSAADSLGIAVVDHDAVLSNGASPAQFVTGTNADSQHPNDAGVTLQGNAALPVLRAYYQ